MFFTKVFSALVLCLVDDSRLGRNNLGVMQKSGLLLGEAEKKGSSLLKKGFVFCC